MHLPVNHPLRNLYRTLTALAGVLLIAFGITTFAAGGDSAFGLRSGPVLGVLTLVAGALAVLVAVVGGQLYHFLPLWLGGAMTAYGVLGLMLVRTDANDTLDLSVPTCSAWMVLGMLIVAGGLYGKTGSRRAQQHVEAVRHKPTGAVPTEGDVVLDRLDPTDHDTAHRETTDREVAEHDVLR
ncbi:MAG: hypothetical protein HOV83_21490 [Catenulispora sp.]|nr:hypothetical protein [Catenulispora sp.]